jgi:hypothetical protein
MPETGGGHYEKRNAAPKNGENHANRERGIMKNEMSSVLLDEKICFIRLSPDTFQNIWQVIMDLKSCSSKKKTKQNIVLIYNHGSRLKLNNAL